MNDALRPAPGTPGRPGAYVAVALLWLVPDKRFERLLAERKA